MSFDPPLKVGSGFPCSVVFLLVLCGCGAESDEPWARAAVTGTVTLDGKPLQEGIVRFVPMEGTHGLKTSAAISEGKFQADPKNGPVVGEHRIEIVSTDDGGYAMDDEQALERLKAAGVRRIEAVRVPAKYNTKSTLTALVTEDEAKNVFEFKLESKPK